MSESKKYRALAVDLDGTLLNTRHCIDKQTVEALARLRAAGVSVIGVTGRSFEEFHPMNGCFDFSRDWAIVQGGSMILQYQRNRILCDFCTIPIEDREKLLTIGRRVGFPPLVYAGDKAYSEPQKNKYHLIYEEMMKHPVTYIPDMMGLIYGNPIGKISMLGEPVAMRKLEQRMYAEGISVSWGFSSPYGIDVVARTKRAALISALEQMGITREETVTVGDSDNDIEMVSFGGLGVAVANATPGLLAVADYITLDNDHNGIADLIDRVILKAYN